MSIFTPSINYRAVASNFALVVIGAALLGVVAYVINVVMSSHFEYDKSVVFLVCGIVAGLFIRESREKDVRPMRLLASLIWMPPLIVAAVFSFGWLIS